jgi:type II secretory pathway component PulK
MSRARRQRGSFARRGVALVVALVVVLLITTFLSQFSFTTSLELRSLQAQKETMQARALARSAFKAVQGALLQDESDFLFGYKQLKQVLAVTAIAWEEGLLTALEIEPLDPLFNLNRLAKIQAHRPGEPPNQDVLFKRLFQNILADVVPLPDETTTFVEPLQPGELSELYAALFDWVDEGGEPYSGIDGVTGAEGPEYFGERPERAPPNRPLERLSEIRLVRGVADSRIPWEIWRSRFSIREPSAGESNLYPGLLNVNGATRDQIVAFLEARRLDPATTNQLSGTLKDRQIALNDYAENADLIASALIPGDVLSQVLSQELTTSDIKARLGSVPGINPNYSNQVFSTSDEYFRVRIVTQVGQMQAELEAVLYTPRKGDRTAREAKVLEYTLR